MAERCIAIMTVVEILTTTKLRPINATQQSEHNCIPCPGIPASASGPLHDTTRRPRISLKTSAFPLPTYNTAAWHTILASDMTRSDVTLKYSVYSPPTGAAAAVHTWSGSDMLQS